MLYASNHLSVNLLPVWRPLPPRASINCCHVTPSHFCFLCNHVLTPVHPSVFILYKCMVLHLSCLSSQFAYFVIAISHLFTYLNMPTVFPHVLPSAFADTSVPFFIIGRSLFCFAQIVYVRCVLTTGNLRFGWNPFGVCIIIQSFFMSRFALGHVPLSEKKGKRTAAFGWLSPYPQIRHTFMVRPGRIMIED